MYLDPTKYKRHLRYKNILLMIFFTYIKKEDKIYAIEIGSHDSITKNE